MRGGRATAALDGLTGKRANRMRIDGSNAGLRIDARGAGWGGDRDARIGPARVPVEAGSSGAGRSGPGSLRSGSRGVLGLNRYLGSVSVRKKGRMNAAEKWWFRLSGSGRPSVRPAAVRGGQPSSRDPGRELCAALPGPLPVQKWGRMTILARSGSHRRAGSSDVSGNGRIGKRTTKIGKTRIGNREPEMIGERAAGPLDGAMF
jgi:hypothetical protein